MASWCGRKVARTDSYTMSDVFVVDAVRLAGGRSGGVLTDAHPTDLAAFVLDGLLSGFEFSPTDVGDVIFGSSAWTDEPRTAARRRVWAYGFPQSLPPVTIARRCASSQDAIRTAVRSIAEDRHDLVVAGGIASFAGAPRSIADAESLARKWGLTRELLDRYAFESHRRARSAAESRVFASEILPLRLVKDNDLSTLHDYDEATLDVTSYTALAKLDPFTEGGLLTSGNSSEPCNGSAALLFASGRAVRRYDLEPLARVMSFSVTDNEREGKLEGVLRATPRALSRAGLRMSDVDLFEVDEMFASVPLAWLKHLDADPAKLNVNGGAIALGNPPRATGARLMTTLVHSLRRRHKRYGLQALSEFDGAMSVTVVEALP